MGEHSSYPQWLLSGGSGMGFSPESESSYLNVVLILRGITYYYGLVNTLDRMALEECVKSAVCLIVIDSRKQKNKTPPPAHRTNSTTDAAGW